MPLVIGATQNVKPGVKVREPFLFFFMLLWGLLFISTLRKWTSCPPRQGEGGGSCGLGEHEQRCPAEGMSSSWGRRQNPMAGDRRVGWGRSQSAIAGSVVRHLTLNKCRYAQQSCRCNCLAVEVTRRDQRERIFDTQRLSAPRQEPYWCSRQIWRPGSVVISR